MDATLVKLAAEDERGRPRSKRPLSVATAVPRPPLFPPAESGRAVPLGGDEPDLWDADFVEWEEKKGEEKGLEEGEPGAGAVATERTEREETEGARDAA